MTIKQCIVNTLKDLTQTDFREFCHLLTDRRDDPRIRRRAVEDKSIWEITDLLVSTFTEPKALQVALDTLRQMNCNQEAKTLAVAAADQIHSASKPAPPVPPPPSEESTKAFLDTGDPTFRRTSAGELEIKPSPEALNYVTPCVAVKKPEEVEADAKALVLSERGNSCNNRLVLSRYKIQFGKYRGQTFKWLLENDVGYIVWWLAEHQKEREGAKGSKRPQSLLDANKDALTKYVSAYPEVLEEVRFHRAYEKSREATHNLGQKGKVLVGIRPYRWETLKELYESKDPQKISFVNFLRTKKLTCDPGSKMEFAVKYILQRDKAKAAAAKRRINRSTRSSTKRWTRREWVQSNRSQPTRASGSIQRNQNWSDGWRHAHYRL